MIFTPEFINSTIPFQEYPRPQFMRKSYFNLNGLWQYAITKSEQFPQDYDGTIVVPYSPESFSSTVMRQPKADEFLIYRRFFSLEKGFNKGRVLLNTGACDQVCKIYLNGKFIGSHEGGYLPFTFDITFALNDKDNELVYIVQDDASSEIYGRGKQSYNRGGIWYTATSGIWQTVWLESVPEKFVKSVKLTPDFNSKTLLVECDSEEEVSITVLAEKGVKIKQKTVGKRALINVENCLPWSPESPNLYPVILKTEHDEVKSYFGLRSYSTHDINGVKYFAVNNKPTFHNGLLDQGYWPDGIYTPPSNKAMYEEIKAVKDMGFNMLRKHIKIEPYLWYYYCDILGVLVWQDMINGGGKYSWLRIHLCPFIDMHINDKNYKGMKRANPVSREWFLKEAEGLINAHYNCVSLCLYTPFNEAWGQFDAVRVWKILKQMDGTRLYDHASGWQDKGGGDVCSKHIYFRKVKMKNDKKRVLALTEFGGYSYALKGHTFTQKEFGYKGFKSEKELQDAYLSLYRNEIIPAIKEAGLCATVYTQICDVEDEINGLFTYDRILKVEADAVKAVNAETYKAFEQRVNGQKN
ncbi:MAG: glycoside hydrolase family 2 [Clostridiales bacterium]|nr:glycoside hydrolase family 2 [Clostridiales bacterium]